MRPEVVAVGERECPVRSELAKVILDVCQEVFEGSDAPPPPTSPPSTIPVTSPITSGQVTTWRS